MAVHAHMKPEIAYSISESACTWHINNATFNAMVESALVESAHVYHSPYNIQQCLVYPVNTES